MACRQGGYPVSHISEVDGIPADVIMTEVMMEPR